MLIVEGADYAGKTTLLEVIRQRAIDLGWPEKYGTTYRFKVQRWGRLPADFDYYRDYLLPIESHGRLCDRFTLSELAYGTVYRGGPNPKFTHHRRRLVARELNRHGSIQVLVKADWETTEKRIASRGPDDMLKSKQQHRDLTIAFDAWRDDPILGDRGVPIVATIDTSGYDANYLDIIITRIMDVWETYLKMSRSVVKFAPQSWGYLRPKFALVGDQVNGGRGTRPFAGGTGRSCCATLSHVLDEAAIAERDYYLLNSRDTAGREIDPEVFDALDRPMVIALGKKSAQILTGLKVPHAEFPHPAWIKRFEYGRISAWGLKFRELVAPALERSAT